MNRRKSIIIRILVTCLFLGTIIFVINFRNFINTGQISIFEVNRFEPLVGYGSIKADSLPIDSTRVMIALSQIKDPELDINIVELGLIDKVIIDSNLNALIIMIVTTPECPFVWYIGEQVLNTLKKIPGIKKITVQFDPTKRWDPSRLTGKAKK